MKCSEVRTFLSQIHDQQEPITSIPPTDLDYLSTNGYVSLTTKDEYDKSLAECAKLSELTQQVNAEWTQEEQARAALFRDTQKEHSILFHFQGKEEKEQLQQKIAGESAEVTKEQSELKAMEAYVNELIQKKSMNDRMVPYDGEYVSLTGLGNVVLNDLNVRNYRVADEEFADFSAEIKSIYAELRSIADRAAFYVNLLKPRIPKIQELEGPYGIGSQNPNQTPSILWSVGIGLAKLQGDTNAIGQRFLQAFDALHGFDSTTSNKLTAAEIMTAASGQDIQSLEDILKNLDKELRKAGVPKEVSAGVGATIMAGRRYDGTYPTDRFTQFRQSTLSFEAAAILAVMNEPYDTLISEFQTFRSMFVSWGYMVSEDTEIASAFLAIGELTPIEVQEKLKYIVEQLRNYLEYPLVAAAILASIPVFEAHEVLDLMEKAVTLLSNYATGYERSEIVALAVRMIHGVRNELVKQIDPTARISQTPVQFTYSPHPGLFFWYYPVIIAHSSYHATFSGMGGFHPAHSHGVGGFAG
jgi:hypothetical protein